MGRMFAGASVAVGLALASGQAVAQEARGACDAVKQLIPYTRAQTAALLGTPKRPADRFTQAAYASTYTIPGFTVCEAFDPKVASTLVTTELTCTVTLANPRAVSQFIGDFSRCMMDDMAYRAIQEEWIGGEYLVQDFNASVARQGRGSSVRFSSTDYVRVWVRRQQRSGSGQMQLGVYFNHKP